MGTSTRPKAARAAIRAYRKAGAYVGDKNPSGAVRKARSASSPGGATRTRKEDVSIIASGLRRGGTPKAKVKTRAKRLYKAEKRWDKQTPFRP